MPVWIAMFVVLSGASLVAASAEAGPGLTDVGAALSLVSLDNGETALGLHARIGLGTVTDAISPVVSVGFWKRKEEHKRFGFVPGVGGIALEPHVLKYQDVVVSVRAMYRLPVGNGRIDPAFGLGPAVHFLRTEISGSGTGRDGTKIRSLPGLDIASETSIEISERIDLLFEFGFRNVFEGSDTDLGNSYDQIIIGAGFVFLFGGR